MSAKALTFEASEESIATVDEIATSRGVDRETVLREALVIYLADYQKLKAELEEAERQIDAGDFLTHEEVVARFEERVRRTKAA
jgi:predicted transcriptional regulator